MAPGATELPRATSNARQQPALGAIERRRHPAMLPVSERGELAPRRRPAARGRPPGGIGAERVRHRPVRAARTRRGSTYAPVRTRPPWAYARSTELLDEPRLAHAGWPAMRTTTGFSAAGPLQRGVERSEVLAAPDEGCPGDRARRPSLCAVSPRQRADASRSWRSGVQRPVATLPGHGATGADGCACDERQARDEQDGRRAGAIVTGGGRLRCGRRDGRLGLRVDCDGIWTGSADATTGKARSAATTEMVVMRVRVDMAQACA